MLPSFPKGLVGDVKIVGCWVGSIDNVRLSGSCQCIVACSAWVGLTCKTQDNDGLLLQRQSMSLMRHEQPMMVHLPLYQVAAVCKAQDAQTQLDEHFSMCSVCCSGEA